MELENRLYTVNEVVKILHVDRRTVYKYVRDGLMKPYKAANRKLYFEVEDIRKFLNMPEQ